MKIISFVIFAVEFTVLLSYYTVVVYGNKVKSVSETHLHY